MLIVFYKKKRNGQKRKAVPQGLDLYDIHNLGKFVAILF